MALLSPLYDFRCTFYAIILQAFAGHSVSYACCINLNVSAGVFFKHTQNKIAALCSAFTSMFSINFVFRTFSNAHYHTSSSGIETLNCLLFVSCTAHVFHLLIHVCFGLVHTLYLSAPHDHLCTCT